MAVASLQRRYGNLALVKGKPPTSVGTEACVPYISTGFPDLDKALGIGGLPKGRVSEMIGPETSGKTTLALKFLEQAQRDSSQVGYIDQARFFDPDYAHRCGLDLSRLIVLAPYGLQESLAMAEALAGSGGLSALIFEGWEGFLDNLDAATQLAASLDRLVAPLARSGMALLFLHAPMTEGSTLLSSLAHHATLRLALTRENWLRRNGDVRGYKAQVEVLKNKLGPAGRVVTITIEFNGTVRGAGL